MNGPDCVDVLKVLAAGRLGRVAEVDALMEQHGVVAAADDVHRRNLLSAVLVFVLEQCTVAIPTRLGWFVSAGAERHLTRPPGRHL